MGQEKKRGMKGTETDDLVLYIKIYEKANNLPVSAGWHVCNDYSRYNTHHRYIPVEWDCCFSVVFTLINVLFFRFFPICLTDLFVC